MLFLFNEFTCDVIRLKSSWFKSSNDVPFGRIYLNNSWFLSHDPFSPLHWGWQKYKSVLNSPVFGSYRIPSISVNSEPLSVSITPNIFL